MANDNSIPMIGDVNGTLQTKMVPSDQVDAAQQAGWESALKMVGPKGQSKWVPQSQVGQARSANFAVTGDNTGVVKMVSPQGSVNYVLPQEVQGFQKQGNTRINPDGSFDLQNIFGEDPLVEQQRYQKVRNALSPSEKSAATKAELKDAGKALVIGTVATAAGAAGAGPLAGGIEAAIAPSVTAVPGGVGFGGAAPTTAAGPSMAAAAGKAALPWLLRGSLVGGGTYGASKILPSIVERLLR